MNNSGPLPVVTVYAVRSCVRSRCGCSSDGALKIKNRNRNVSDNDAATRMGQRTWGTGMGAAMTEAATASKTARLIWKRMFLILCGFNWLNTVRVP
jgi:hypothetical protein